MRAIIDLPDEQAQALAARCRRRPVSRAEAVRRAVGEMLDRQRLAGREQAFGAWSARGDSRVVVEQLRTEWGA